MTMRCLCSIKKQVRAECLQKAHRLLEEEEEELFQRRCWRCWYPREWSNESLDCYTTVGSKVVEGQTTWVLAEKTKGERHLAVVGNAWGIAPFLLVDVEERVWM